MRQAIAAFKEKRYDEAGKILEKVRKEKPDDPLAAYYMGNVALQRDDIKETVRHWRDFVLLDPAAARDNDVPRRLTLLKKKLREQEVQVLLDREENLSKAPPVPNSIAVFPFQNTGDAKYDIMAKGLAALIIADLSKVPGLTVLERENVQAILDEIKLSESGLVDDDAKVRAGRLLRAEKVMNGTYEIE